MNDKKKEADVSRPKETLYTARIFLLLSLIFFLFSFCVPDFSIFLPFFLIGVLLLPAAIVNYLEWKNWKLILSEDGQSVTEINWRKKETTYRWLDLTRLDFDLERFSLTSKSSPVFVLVFSKHRITIPKNAPMTKRFYDKMRSKSLKYHPDGFPDWWND